MKYLLSTILGTIFLTGCHLSENSPNTSLRNYDDLKQHFESPEQIYGVNCWWWWLNGNVTKAAITKDLEAMKEKSFQGAMIFDAGGHNQRGNRDIPAGPLFGSPEWNDLFVFALDEAKRLGLEIGFNIQSGWNLGGPCVTPRYAAKQLTYSETTIDGGTELRTQLPQPESRDDFYRDIAVLAFPADADRQTDSIIENLDYKLGFHELGGSAPDCRFLLGNEPPQTSLRRKPPHTIGRTGKCRGPDPIDGLHRTTHLECTFREMVHSPRRIHLYPLAGLHLEQHMARTRIGLHEHRSFRLLLANGR